MPPALRTRPNKRPVYTSPPPFEEEYCKPYPQQDDNREWEVECIVGWREDDRTLLVQWANADGQTFKKTWEPIENLGNSRELIEEYHLRTIAERIALPVYRPQLPHRHHSYFRLFNNLK